MEVLKTKTEEEVQLEKELNEVRESTRLAREDLKKAEKELKKLEAGDEKTFTSKTKKVIQAVSAAALLAGGGYGVKKANDHIDANWGVNDTGAVYTSAMQSSYQVEAKKVHEKIVELQAEKVLKRNKVNAEFELNKRNRLEREKALDTTILTTQVAEATRVAEEARLAAEKMAREAAARALEAEEREKMEQDQINKIKEKMERMAVAKSLTDTFTTAPERLERTRTLQGGTPVNLHEGVRPIGGIPPENYSGRPSAYWGGTPSGFYGPTFSSENLANEKSSEIAKNPYKLDAKTLEKVAKVYEDNVEKLLPKDTLENWIKIKDKSAYEFMKEKKVSKPYKDLHEYLQKIQRTSDLDPGSGVKGAKETIENYIERVLEHEASKGLAQLDNLAL